MPRLAIRLSIAGLLAGLLLGACERTLPEGSELTVSPWSSFDEAKAAYDRVEPGRTSRAELHGLGFEPHKTPNVAILSYLEVQQRFLPNQSVRIEDLEPGVRTCLEAKSACSAYEISPGYTYTERVGGTVADMLNFNRHTIRTGWTFKALILLQNDIAVYKIWQGKPNIRIEEKVNNPFGPLQDLGGVARDAAVPDI